MQSSASVTSHCFDLRVEEPAPPSDRPWMHMSPRLAAYRADQKIVHIAFGETEGHANIYGAWASDSSGTEEVEEALSALLADLKQRHGARPVLSIRRSRWPLAKYWPALRDKGLVEIPEVAETT